MWNTLQALLLATLVSGDNTGVKKKLPPMLDDYQVWTQRMTLTSQSCSSYSGRAEIWISLKLCQLIPIIIIIIINYNYNYNIIWIIPRLCKPIYIIKIRSSLP